MKDTRHSEVTLVFCQLGNRPSTITNQHLDVLEYFMIRLYNPDLREISSDLASERIFAIQSMLDNDLRKLPISCLGLVEHAKRSCYQAGYLQRCRILPADPHCGSAAAIVVRQLILN